MKTTGKLLPVLGLTALALIMESQAGAAGTIDEPTMLKRAGLVFEGIVERVDYAFSDPQGGTHPRIPHTFVTYRIADVIRGDVQGDTITLRFIGGRGDEAEFLMASELPLFDIGDRDVLLVSGNTVSGCPLVGCSAGRFRVIQGHVFNDEGQAIELDSAGKLALGAYYDLPEVMTHKVSQTTLVRHDHFEQGESRVAYRAEAVGTQLTARDLTDRLQGVARSLPAAAKQERSADVAQPFTLAAFIGEPAPAEQARMAPASGAATAAEADEIEALRRSGGNPVLDRDTQ
jgi:hypothetical protein